MKRLLRIGLILSLIITLLPSLAFALQYELSFSADVFSVVGEWDLPDFETETSIGEVHGSVIYSIPEVSGDDIFRFTFEAEFYGLGLDKVYTLNSLLLDVLTFQAGELSYDWENKRFSGEGAFLGFFDLFELDETFRPPDGLTSDEIPDYFNYGDWDLGLFGYAGFDLINPGSLELIVGKVNEAILEEYTAPVPEPTTMLLLGTGLACIAGIRRKMKK